MIKAFLFDMDGTLANSEEHYVNCAYKSLCDLGYSGPKQEINKIIGMSMEQVFAFVSELIHVSYEEAKKLSISFFTECPIHYKDYIFPDAVETIKELKSKGYKTALCTANEKPCIDDFMSCGFENLFDLIIGPHDVSNNKPKPDIYLKALEILNIQADEAIVVEDSTNGIAAGKNAGIYTIAKYSEFNIDQSQADMMIKDLRELLEINK